MPTFGPANAQCHVLTQKEGLLSAIAHDLSIEVTEFSIEVTDSSVSMRCNPNSLRVQHAMKDGQPIDVLSAKDRQEIQWNILKDVLETNKYPEITFASSEVTRNAEGSVVKGTLTLHGVTKELQAQVRTDSGWHIAEIAIHQPDFGIKPYTAMLGTLKVRADVRVRVAVPIS